VVLWLPWLTYIWWRKERRDWLASLLVFIAWPGLLIPLFVRWVSQPDISHITDFGVDITVVLLVLLVGRRQAEPAEKERHGFVLSGYAGLVLMMVPGAVLMGVQLTASQQTVLAEHYGDPEARLAQQTWGRLPVASKVLGPVGTPSILTGQLTAGIYALPPGTERPIWETMLVAPRLEPLVQDGFDFVFVDSRWWNALDQASQHDLENPCIRVWARGQEARDGRFLEILDLRACR
jgi:hypothetical protein